MNTVYRVGILIVLLAIGVGMYWGMHRLNASGTYDAFSIARQVNTRNDSETSTASTTFYTINARYPVGAKDSDGIMSKFVLARVEEKKTLWRVDGEEYKAAQELVHSYPDMPTPHYEYDVDYKQYTSDALHTSSYVFTMYEFTGGAHGSTKLATFTFATSTPLAIDSIISFEDGRDIELTKLLRAKLVQSLGDMADEDMLDQGLGLAFLNRDGSFNAKKCQCDGFFFGSNFQNFYITDAGITFIMNQYQVAPYVAGMPEVLLSWRELEPFMQKNNSLFTH